MFNELKEQLKYSNVSLGTKEAAIIITMDNLKYYASNIVNTIYRDQIHAYQSAIAACFTDGKEVKELHILIDSLYPLNHLKILYLKEVLGNMKIYLYNQSGQLTVINLEEVL